MARDRRLDSKRRQPSAANTRAQQPPRRRSLPPLQLMRELEQRKAQFGGGSGAQKLELLRGLARARMPSAKAVVRLHEALCFLRAHPDDEGVLAQVTAMLDAFDRRPDLRRFATRLADSGIAGTTIRFAFYGGTARWLARRLPGALRLVWPEGTAATLLQQRLPQLVLWGETPGLDEVEMSLADWVRRLAGPDCSDADFLIERLTRLGRTDQESLALFEELDLEFELPLVGRAPSRTSALLPGRPVHFQTTPLRRERPDLRRAVRETAKVRAVDAATGARLIALARESMVLRHRDLDAFSYADARDVRLFDCGGGLEFAVIGVVPERRLLLESVYAYLTLQNGVPIGYVLTSSLFGSCEVAYNVFDTWRGGEAGLVYGKVLAVSRQLFGAEDFTIYPYQLGGGGNQEGLQSGSWWFYQKLGFRARDPDVLAGMRDELAKMAKRPSYRTPIATLARLAEANVYWSPTRLRPDVIGVLPLANVGLAVTDHIARHFGADRERGERVCADEAAAQLGVRGSRDWSPGERLAWLRWGPLLRILPGIATWSPAEHRALVAVVRAKGGRRESDFVRRFDAHPKLRAALRRLAATTAR